MWHDRCPTCGQGKAEPAYDTALVEPGFAEPAQVRLTGVQGASSFTWIQAPDDVERCCAARPWESIVEDEYGRLNTGQEFLQMLEIGCPIRLTHHIGEWWY
jgi:hypothetical protein